MTQDTIGRRRIGIIGAGLIGIKRTIAFDMLGCNIVAVFDPDVGRSKALAERPCRNGAPEVKNDLTSLFETVGSGGIVVVATPHAHLSASARSAINEGLHVLLEKPGSVASRDLEELNELAIGNKCTVHVGYNHRFHPGIRALRDAVMGREYGKVLSIRGVYGHGGRIGYQDEWRFQRQISGGGELLDQGSHLIDLAQFITGDRLDYQFSKMSNLYWGGEVEDNAFVSLIGRELRFEAWLHASWTEWKNRFLLEVFCERAKLEVSGLVGSYGSETFRIYEMGEELGPPKIMSVEYPPGDTSWDSECRDLLTAIDEGVSYGATLEDAVAVLRIVERAYTN